MKQIKAMIERFSFGQMTSNENGKTSASGTMGVIICVIGTLCFLMGCIDKMFLNKDIDVITQSIIFVGIGAGLLGYRKSKEKKVVSKTEQVSQVVEQMPQPIQQIVTEQVQQNPQSL